MSDETRIWVVRIDVGLDKCERPYGKYVAECLNYYRWSDTPDQAVTDLKIAMIEASSTDPQLADIRDMHAELEGLREAWHHLYIDVKGATETLNHPHDPAGSISRHYLKVMEHFIPAKEKPGE